MVQNLKDLMAKFSDEQACIDFLIQQRWGGSPVCPHCGSDKWYKIEQGKRFKCGNNACYKKYSVTVGSIFHASNIPLSKWFPAVYIILSHKKGISSHQLAKDLGVTQKTAWFMMHRIRESLKDKNSTLLGGTVEVDECYMSRKLASDYKGYSDEEVQEMIKKKPHLSQKRKGAIMGLAQRDGNIKVKVFDTIDGQTAKQHIKENVLPGSNVYTDSSSLYRIGLDEYNRGSVRHNAVPKEFAKGDIHVNTVESFFGMFKRGYYGIYHYMSYKHLQRYCDEFAHRRNTRHLKDGERFELSLQKIEGKLPYKILVHGKSSKAQD